MSELENCKENLERSQSLLTRFDEKITALKAEFEETKINRHKAENARVEVETTAKQLLVDYMAEFDAELAQRRENLAEAVRSAEPLPVVFNYDLNAVDWSQYNFNQEFLATQMPTGGAAGVPAEVLGTEHPLVVPKFEALLGSNNCFVIHEDDEGFGMEAMHERVARLAAMMPHSAKFAFFDKKDFGAAFRYQGSLPRTRQHGSDMQRTLEDIAGDIERITRKFDLKVQSILDFDESIRRNEGFEFIFVANFPEELDRRNIEMLARIARGGPRCGKYLFLHMSPNATFPNGTSMDLFENVFELNTSEFVPVKDSTFDAILSGISNTEKQETELKFDEGTSFTKDLSRWWQEDPSKQISTPVGGSGAKKDDMRIWFGEGKDSVCAHGMLGATTGAGKSNLYHAFIMGLACRYSPQDLEFYLVDGKQGVEFDAYRSLPHARVVSLFTSPRLARSVLEELVDEMERRNTLFTEHGVSSFSEYRKLGQPGGNLARVIAVVDEYQTFFEDDRDGEGSELMLKLVSQSRSAGIHLFVGSQRFNVAGMQKQQAIFGNMHMRVGMKMTASDITALNEFQAGGKAMLRSCQEVGQAVINDALGDDSSNISGRIFRMPDDLRRELIVKLNEKWQAEFPERELEAPVILNGSEQPKLSENPQLLHVLHHFKTRPTAEQWQAYAVQPEHTGGIAVSDWYPVESPQAFWLGKEQSIHGQAVMVLRRRHAENLLIVGDNNEARLGLLTALTAQLLVNHSAADVALHVYDSAIEGSPWYGVVAKAAELIGLPANVMNGDAALLEQLTQLNSLIEARAAMSTEERNQQQTVYLVLNDVQRANALQLTQGRFGNAEPSEAGKLLLALLQRGPELGVHVWMAADSFRGISQVLEKQQINFFRHRVALQMTDDDSFKFINSRDAAKLQAHGPRPIHALYIEEMQNRKEQFKPYAYSKPEALAAELEALRTALARW